MKEDHQSVIFLRSLVKTKVDEDMIAEVKENQKVSSLDNLPHLIIIFF